jgi:DNA-binding NarL/FixJ family response regulator
MPLLNGLDASRIVLSQTPQTKIIFLTMHADRYFITEAFRAGAAGYVLKQSAGDELLAAIDEVIAGRRYLSPRVSDEALSFVLKDDLETEFRPTLRQREVLQLIAEGKQMKEIAAILDISRRTAESHKYGMMRTLNITSNAELIQYAIKIGLVTI